MISTGPAVGEIAQKSFETLVVRVAMQLCATLGAIVVARSLGPAGKGLFTYAGTMLAFILMATAGHYKAVLWQCGKLGYPPSAVTAVMARVVVLVCIPIVAGLVAVAVGVPSQRVLLAVAAAVPFAVYAQSAMGVFLAGGSIRAVNMQQVFPTVLATAAYVPLLIFGPRSVAVPLAVIAAAYVAAALYTFRALRSYRDRDESAADPRALAREQVHFGSQAAASGVAAFLNFRIDVFLVMFMLGSTALGIYSIGVGIGEFLWQLSSAMINPSLKYIGGPDERTAAEMTAKCMRHSLFLVVTASVLAAIAARPFVPLIYGPAFAYGAVVTLALLPGIVAYSMMPALSAFFSQQLGRPSLPLYFSLASTAICGIFTALTLPRFGIIAGAAATSLSYTMTFAAAAAYFVAHTKIGPGRIFRLRPGDLAPYRSALSRCVGALRGV